MTQTLTPPTSSLVAATRGPRDHMLLEIHGSYQERFEGVRDLFAEHFNNGADTGASFAVFIDGEPVIDLWGGFVDRDFTRPWQRNTIVNTFSTTKMMTSLTALLLADRGVIDLDAPVAKYWPEFAANGKQDVLVRHLISHTSGLPTWDAQLTLTDMYDWEKSTALLAAQAPLHRPGDLWSYHAFTVGHLVGEVVRRATGLTLGTVFQQELAGPPGGLLGRQRRFGDPRRFRRTDVGRLRTEPLDRGPLRERPSLPTSQGRLRGTTALTAGAGARHDAHATRRRTANMFRRHP